MDSFALRRTEDSLRVVAAEQHYADSIAHLPPEDTTLRYIIGFHHVRIFSDSLQAVADSLYYSTKDSIFRLFYNPVAWGSGNYQITGDTMYMYTKNKKADRLYVFENALAINRVAKALFNQLKGTTINCYFRDGQINYIRAKGNAESIYYIADEKKAFTGANRAHGDIIDMVFGPKLDSTGKVELDSAGKPKGRELDRVVIRSDAEGTMTPMRRVIPGRHDSSRIQMAGETKAKVQTGNVRVLHTENEDENFEAAEKAAEHGARFATCRPPDHPDHKAKAAGQKDIPSPVHRRPDAAIGSPGVQHFKKVLTDFHFNTALAFFVPKGSNTSYANAVPFLVLLITGGLYNTLSAQDTTGPDAGSPAATKWPSVSGSARPLPPSTIPSASNTLSTRPTRSKGWRLLGPVLVSAASMNAIS